tara:strand:+ start:448 stop:1227 length:780 start_codon:yes stop_codon:yes gene_type:complete
LKEKEQKSIISIAAEAMGLMSLIFTVFLFCLGHLAAYLYFSSFDIPYLKYTNLYTAFNFALSSIDVVLCIFLLFISFLFFLFKYILKASHTYNFNNYKIKRIYFFKFIIKSLPVAFLILYVFNLFGDVISSTDLKKSLLKKEFLPFQVTYNRGNSKLTCVAPVGTLGEYQVFLNENLQPTLIAETNIIDIKLLFSSPPMREVRKGADYAPNPKFKEELKVWHKMWDDVCYKNKKTDFIKFDFLTNLDFRKPAYLQINEN